MPTSSCASDSRTASCRTLFDDHVYDMAMAGLVPDRGFDDVPVRYEIPERARSLLQNGRT